MSKNNNNHNRISFDLNSNAKELLLLQRRLFFEYCAAVCEDMESETSGYDITDEELANDQLPYLEELASVSNAAFLMQLITMKENQKISAFICGENSDNKLTLEVNDSEYIEFLNNDATMFDNAKKQARYELEIVTQFLWETVGWINTVARDPECEIAEYDEHDTWFVYDMALNVINLMYYVGLISKKHLDVVIRVLSRDTDKLYGVYIPFYTLDDLIDNNRLFIPKVYEWDDIPETFIFGDRDGIEVEPEEDSDSDDDGYVTPEFNKVSAADQTEEEIRQKEKALMNAFIAKSQKLKDEQTKKK